MKLQLDKIFKPQAIAVIGASSRANSLGFSILKNIIQGGFKGKLYPVNPKYADVQGLKCEASVQDIDGAIDLAVIATPIHTIVQILEECGQKGIQGALILSVGFRELGVSKHTLYEKIKETARAYRIRIIGPNGVGLLHPKLGINASFLSKKALPGKIAFISQSSALCASILDWAIEQQVGFSKFVSIGSMLDVDFADLIDYFGMDGQTSCILIYMESLTEAKKFMSAARAFSQYKPIIVLKAGKSMAGAEIAFSHTGSLAGNDAIFDAAFRRAGVIRVETISQLFDCAQALATQPHPKSNRLAIVSNAGGPSILATDYLVEQGGQIASLSEETIQKLSTLMPAQWTRSNPVNISRDATPEVLQQVVQICQMDQNVDGVLVIFTAQSTTHPTMAAQALADLKKSRTKSLFACWMGEQEAWEAREILEEAKIPNYRYPESPVEVFLKMYHYEHNLEILQETPPSIPINFEPQKAQARALIQRTIQADRRQLNEYEAKTLLRMYDIPTARGMVVQSREEAVEAAQSIGFPVAMKIVSPDINHKSDVGGVRLNLKSPRKVKRAFVKMMEQVKRYDPSAHIEGVLIEQMINKRYEIFIGAKKDPIFGPIIVFGAGGLLVKLYDDTNIGLPPLNMNIAQRIIEKTKMYELLQGYRNLPPVDLEFIQFLLVKFSYLLMDFPEIREIDINPFAVDENGGFALDAHIILHHQKQLKPTTPFDHLVITPYPKRYERVIQAKNKQEVLLRPILPEDEPLEKAMFDQLSEESIYYRFMGYVPKISHDFLVRYTQIDYDREMAIIALIDSKENPGVKEMIGVVRLVTDAWKEEAEYAIILSDQWQGQGLGSQMTDFIFEIARDMGIQKIVASVLKHNNRMIQIFEKRGFKVVERDLAELVMALDLEAGVELVE